MGLECGKEVKEREKERERFSKISNNIFFLFLENLLMSLLIWKWVKAIYAQKKESTQGAQNPYHFPP